MTNISPITPPPATPASNSPAGEHLVCPATTADVGHLAETLADAFYEDPIYGWLMPSDRRRRAGLRRFFELQLRVFGLAHGNVWTTGKLAGAAISLPPGKWRLPISTTLLNGAGYTRAFGVHTPRALAYLLVMEHRHLHEPHHYVATVGVGPASQGEGLGTKLLGPTLDLCDTHQLPAYIEATSELNAALYERLGFELTGEMRFGGSPPLRLMVRRPISPQALQ